MNDEYKWNGDPDCCQNCGGSVFVTDYQHGSVSCYSCGCCRDDLVSVVDCPRHDRETADGMGFRQESFTSAAVFEEPDSERAHQRNKRKNSPPYKRETYWSERISQWRLQEPEIEREHWQEITDKWEEFTGRWRIPGDSLPRFAQARWQNSRCNLLLTKELCRQLLWAIDDEIRRVGGRKPIFVKKFLVSFLFTLSCGRCACGEFCARWQLSLSHAILRVDRTGCTWACTRMDDGSDDTRCERCFQPSFPTPNEPR